MVEETQAIIIAWISCSLMWQSRFQVMQGSWSIWYQRREFFLGFEIVVLTEDRSVRLQNKMPLKLKDPGSLTYLFQLENLVPLMPCDMNASINLMPFCIYRKLGLREVK